MSYPAFIWSNPTTIGWNVTDASGNPVLGAAVKATLYSGRSLDTPDQTPGTPVTTMNNLTLAEVGGGLYSVDVQASAIPAIGPDYVLVIEARVGGILIRHWEEDTAVNPISARNPLCSLASIKDHLGITDNTQDTSLMRVILSTSMDFLNRIRRPGFYPANDHTSEIEVFNWQSESRMEDIFLPHWPLNSVASVAINDLTPPLPQYDPTNPDVLGWTFDQTLPDEERQKLTLRGLYWPIFETGFTPRRSVYRPAPMRVTIVYNAGYTEVPADVEQAIVEWVAYKRGFAQLQSKDPTSQSLYLGSYRQDTMVGNAMLKAMNVDLPDSVKSVISIYQRPII
jgi:hypothetical protein